VVAYAATGVSWTAQLGTPLSVGALGESEDDQPDRVALRHRQATDQRRATDQITAHRARPCT